MINFMWDNFFRRKNHTVFDFLSKQPLFSELSRKEISIIERLVHHRSFFSGEDIFKPNSSIGLFMIMQGKVHIFYEGVKEKEPLVVSRLGDGDFFGELSLVQDKTYKKTSAKAVEACELYGFFKPELLDLIEKSPKTGAKILMKLSEILGIRLQKAGEKLAQFPS